LRKEVVRMKEQLDMFEVMYKKLMTKRKVKLGTFFSGIGAPEMALNELSKQFNFNYETMFYSEIDKYAIKAYCAIHNQKEDDCLGSITDIKGVDLPYCDMWVGGFPCTDISLVGKNKGFAFESNTRSSLGWEMIRLLREVKEKPKYILFENVKPITNETNRPILNLFKNDLENLGYTLYEKIIYGYNFDIPQTRPRYFLVAILGKYNYKFPKPLQLTKTVQGLLEPLNKKNKISHKMKNYIKSENSNYTGNNGNVLINRTVAATITTRDGDSRADSSYYYCPTLPLNYNVKDIDDISKYEFYKLSNLERFRLFGFSDESFYKVEKVCSKAQVKKQIGNSIVVNVLEAIFKNLFMLEEEQ
jgi:DNA (cytosine-5)-methyltransferase 1